MSIVIKQNKCICCIPCKNVAKYLKKIFINIEKLHNLFEHFFVCFFFDSSVDRTLYMLKTYQKNHSNVTLLINNTKPLKLRTHRIAYARNKLINHIKNNHADAQYFIMMGCDSVCSLPLKPDVLKYHLKLNNWDALSFNRSGLGRNGNYDIWALQYEPFIHHCHGFLNNSQRIINTMRKDITEKLNKLKKDNLFECYSAYNGFAIYKTQQFINCEYDGKTQTYFSKEKLQQMIKIIKKIYKLKVIINDKHINDGPRGGLQNCEHIGFHLQAIRKNNAKIRISGELIFENK